MARHPRGSAAARALAAQTALPPAGDARRDELKRRTDTLEQQGEEQFAQATAIDPSAFDEDREILARADGFEVTDREAGYIYCWSREDKPGDQVRWKLAQRVTMPDGGSVSLWQVVQGDMKEAKAERDVRGYRKIGDTILLRARLDRYRQYQIEAQERTYRAERGTSEGLEDLAARSKGLVKVYSEADISNPDTLARSAQAGMARSAFNRKLREGTAHHV